jgi:ubiquitin C-terminal hydrolase
MTSKEEKIFIVENGFNTCYIDSLLMALFYSPSHIYETMLNCDPVDLNFMYFQEIIKTNFIESVRKNNSVLFDTMNEIRNYAFINGWKNDNPDEMIEQQDVNEFYIFLQEHLNTQYIELKRYTVTEGLLSKDDDGTIEKVPFISLQLKQGTETTIPVLLNAWLNDNPVDIKRETINSDGDTVTSSIKGLNIFRLNNIPSFIPLSINRFDSSLLTKITTKVDIKEKIKLFDNSGDYSNIRWTIHAVICHTGDSLKNGHYYTLLHHSNKWLLFDDMSVPCLKEIEISNTIVVDKIKSECVFIIYRYDSFN